MKQQQDKQQSH